jgi:hypothetical protein
MREAYPARGGFGFIYSPACCSSLAMFQISSACSLKVGGFAKSEVNEDGRQFLVYVAEVRLPIVRHLG